MNEVAGSELATTVRFWYRSMKLRHNSLNRYTNNSGYGAKKSDNYFLFKYDEENRVKSLDFCFEMRDLSELCDSMVYDVI